MVNQFSEMNMQSSRGGSRGGPRGAPRYPGVRGYRERDERSQPHRFNDQDSEGDNFRGGPQGYYNGGGHRGGGRGNFQSRGGRGSYGPPRGGFAPHNKFPHGGPPPHMMGQNGGPRDFYGMRGGGRDRGDFMGQNDWRGAGFVDGERDDFYPDRVSTHLLQSSERYQKDWSKMGPRDMNLEAKLYDQKYKQGEINFDNWKNIPVETSGTNLPEPISTFKDVGLGEILENNIELVGIKQPTPVQMYSTNIVKSKRDLMACAQTGSGKTAAFLIPILSNLFEEGPPTELREGQMVSHKVSPLVLILAPTRELASQIFEMTQHLCYRSCVRPYVVYGGSNIDKCIDHLSLGVEVLVATPGRLIDLLNRGELDLGMVRYLVLDEADRMLDMGFEKDIRTIVADYNMALSPTRQTLMFSATFPKPIQILAKDFMNDYIFLTVGRVGSTNDNISQHILYVRRNEKIPELIRVISEESKDRILVFVRTKADTEKIQAVLMDEGFSVICIHGSKSQRMRENALNQFRNGDRNVLVATEVAARGLDIPHISHVINFDMPDTIDNYVHRIGRTGRMGNPGKSTSFFSDSDWHIAPGLTELLKESSQEVPQFLGRNMKYASGNSSGPRNKFVHNNDKFGGRDYRRGPQFATNSVRYSNSLNPGQMKPQIRSFNSNPPNFYNQMHPFGQAMAYQAGPYVPSGHGSFNNYNANRDPNPAQSPRAESTTPGPHTPNSGSQPQTSNAQPIMTQGPGGLVPPPLMQQNQQQGFVPAAAFALGGGNQSDGMNELNSSPVPNSSTPAHFPLYASSSAAAIYSQFQNANPAAFNARSFTAGAAQFGAAQEIGDVGTGLANAQTGGLVRPFVIGPNLAGGIAGLTGGMQGLAAPSPTGPGGNPANWGAWQQENQ